MAELGILLMGVGALLCGLSILLALVFEFVIKRNAKKKNRDKTEKLVK